MALNPATTFNFDGLAPYADDQSADTSGVYHAHKIKQGSTLTVIFNFSGITVADYTFAAQFRRGYGSGNAIQATASFANTGASQVTMTVTDELTAVMEAAAGVWDLEATYTSSGETDRWLSGSYDVTPEVTL